MTIKDELNRAAPLVDRVNDAIRENPLAAGLIGAGVAWMLFSTKGISVAKNATSKAASAVMEAGATLANGVRKTTSDVATAARDIVSSVGDRTVSIVPDIGASSPIVEKSAEAMNEAGATIRENVQSAVASSREYGQVLQSRLSNRLERQPLLLGAIGLAIGAGIASTFATTEMESQWFGEHGHSARNALQEAVGDAKDRGRKVVSEVQEEATRQGLTLEAAKEGASTVADKFKNVAGTAKEAVTKPFVATN